VRIIDIISLSFGNLRRNMLRTVLTISGVVVGIGTIVFLVSLGFGLQELAVSKVANLDAITMVTVNPSQKEGTLLNQDAVDKFKKIKGVIGVSPLLSFPATMTAESNTGDTIAYGVDPKYFSFEDITTDYGAKNFSGENANEMIVSMATLKAAKITDPTEALGKTYTVQIVKIIGNNQKQQTNLDLKIIGVTKEDSTKYAYTPLNVLDKFDDTTFNSVKVKVDTREDVAPTRKSIESMGYPTNSISDTVDQINQVFLIVKFVLGGFGFIALMVAAIGIFNTLTIALLERTHEIGIMKAIGGRNSDVALVFTAEASMIGFFGGIFGVSIGWLLGILINLLINFVATSVGGSANTLFSTPLWFAGSVIAFSFVVSTIAGIMPARRAAKLDPLEALRYE
jgi:putative ABC transport system permease protein